MRRQNLTAATAVGLLIVALSASTAFGQNELTLNTRIRQETGEGSGRWHSLQDRVAWDPAQTAIVVCDMWDKHWCPNSTARVGELAPAMNEVIRIARDKGVMIIHCPSDTLDFYQDTPQRKLAEAAPVVKTKIPLQNWCHLDSAVEGASLPIDDSDGGCDCAEPVKNYRAWSRQHPAIEIAPQDAITDSAEAFYLMQQRGITNVIVMGVHTNMCVLGRPFSIRQMVQQGQNVVLMRDMTDTMYNPAMAPFVSHFTGTDLVVEHIEQHWCPTILSSDFTGKPEFRFEQDRRPHLVVLCAESEYETAVTLPAFAQQELGHDLRVSFVWHDEDDRNRLPGIDVIGDADVLLVSVRRRTLPPKQLEVIRRFVAAGKPVVGIRTASHAFCLRKGTPPDGLVQWLEFDQDVMGGSYTNHHGNGPITSVSVSGNNLTGHPVLMGVDMSQFKGYGSLYKVSPLQQGATPVLNGTIPDADADPEPVAWLFHRSDGGTTFYTSLGHKKDFEQPAFRTMLKNAIMWAVKQQP
jgi:nicotinamidase-related amidase/type 1 glutamine amidotransferase